jgi:ureidoglycolate lyase
MPGDDVAPERFVSFWCDGSHGHPNVWHGAIVPLGDHAKFLDRQGRVHARVSVDFAREFGCYLAVPMERPGDLTKPVGQESSQAWLAILLAR